MPSKLLTSTVTPNFDRVSQINVKNLGAPQFKIGNLSQKLFSLKYFLLYKKKIKTGATVCFAHFSSCWFLPVEVRCFNHIYPT